jgi:adenosylcobinamide-phosphate synthase
MVNSATSRRLLGAAAGLLADRCWGEPPTSIHPVAAFGRLMTGVEETMYADERGAGARYVATGLAAALTAGIAAGSTTLAVALSASGRTLRATARHVAAALAAGDLRLARARLPALVGRDPDALDESGIAAATVESLAENTVDAVVAPAVFGAVLGAPGVAAHRAVDTLDSMVGYRTARYEHFGWAGAHLDDAAAFVPARLTAALVCLRRPTRVGAVVTAVRRDAPGHPSPNGGVAEAAFAGALGVELGGPTRYAGRLEDRPRLGDGPRPGATDIERAAQLADDVELLLVGLLVGFGLGLGLRRRAS